MPSALMPSALMPSASVSSSSASAFAAGSAPKLRLNSEPSPENYSVGRPYRPGLRTSFTGISVGTEQELGDVKISKEKNGSAHIAIVRVRTDREQYGLFGEALLEVTTDIGGATHHTGDLYDYTLEIKATPTEMAEPAPGQGPAAAHATQGDRVDAFKELAARINAMGSLGGRLLPTDAGPSCYVDISNSVHLIRLDESGRDMSGGGSQITVGLATADLLQNSPKPGEPQTASSAILGLIRRAPWYQPQLEAELVPPAATGPSAPPSPASLSSSSSPPAPAPDSKATATTSYDNPEGASKAFAYLVSIISFLAELLQETQEKGGQLYDSAIKNKWQILPRTKPWDILNELTPADRAKVQQAIREHRLSGSPAWDQARDHVTSGRDLAGHPAPRPAIQAAGEPQPRLGSLFEFRDGPPHGVPGAKGSIWDPDIHTPQRVVRPDDNSGEVRGGKFIAGLAAKLSPAIADAMAAAARKDTTTPEEDAEWD
jgi:hypothetical protein